MPNFRLEVSIEKVSKSDMDYIISQLEDAVGLCNGKVVTLKNVEADTERSIVREFWVEMNNGFSQKWITYDTGWSEPTSHYRRTELTDDLELPTD